MLEEETVYPYLKKNARDRLAAARDCARRTGMLRRSLVHLGGYTWCLFPWLGTRSFRTLRRFISEATPARFGLSGIDFEGCCYITFKLQSGDARGLCAHWASVASAGINAEDLVPHGYAPSFDKYDGALPPDLCGGHMRRIDCARMSWRLASLSCITKFGEDFRESPPQTPPKALKLRTWHRMSMN